MVEDDTPGHVREDRAAVIVDGEEEAASRVEGEARDIATVREGQGVRFVAVCITQL